MVRYAEEDKDLEKDKTDRGTNHVMLPSEMMYSFILGFGFSLQGDPSPVSIPPFIRQPLFMLCSAAEKSFSLDTTSYNPLFILLIGANSPDIVKDTTAANKEALEVSEAVKKAPLTVKKQSEFLCCVLL